MQSKIPLLKNADGNIIPAHGIGHFSMMFGPLYLTKKMIVADITDDVVVGADLLLRDNSGPAYLLFSKNIIISRGVEIPIEGPPYTIRKVRLVGDQKLHPMSETIVDVSIDLVENELESMFVIEGNPTLAEKYKAVLAPGLVDVSNTICQKVRIMNPFSESVELLQDTVVGFAEPVDGVDLIDEVEDPAGVNDNCSVRRIQLGQSLPIRHTDSPTKSAEKSTPYVPEHVQKLFQDACDGRNKQETEIVAHFLTSYSDIFSRSDTDIGKTHLTEHCIETGDVKPVKIPPQRIPLAFAGEAEEQGSPFPE